MAKLSGWGLAQGLGLAFEGGGFDEGFDLRKDVGPQIVFVGILNHSAPRDLSCARGYVPNPKPKTVTHNP